MERSGSARSDVGAIRRPARAGLHERYDPDESVVADLVLLDANPLEDITNTRRIQAVVTNGKLLRRADLDRLLAEAAAPTSRGPAKGPQ
jgi:hypothetical protein